MRTYNPAYKACSLILTLVLGFMGACSEEDDDDEATTSSNPEATTAASNITEGSAASVMTSTNTVIKSAQIGTLAVSLADNDTQSTNDSNCSNNGDPWDATTSAVRTSGNGYTGHKFYCKLNSNVIESTDTIPGFVTQQQSIFCSIEENFSVTVDSFTSAGAELVSNGSATMTLSDACWSQGKPDGMESVPVSSVVATLLDESSAGWQYQIKMVSSAVGTITLKYFNKNGVFGFQNTQAGTDPGAGTDIKVVVDTTKGVLLFNEVEDRNGSGGSNSVYRGLSRLRVKGTMSSTLTFSEITEGRGYIYVSGPDFDASADQDHTYSVYTVDGNSTAGWQFRHYATSSAGVLALSTTECSDGDGTCSASQEVASIEDMQTYFKGPDSVRDVWKTYAASGLPMCEPSSGSNSDVTVVAQPVNTGAVGVCSE